MKRISQAGALTLCIALFLCGCNSRTAQREPVADSANTAHNKIVEDNPLADADDHAGHDHAEGNHPTNENAGHGHSHNTSVAMPPKATKVDFSIAPSTPIAGQRARWTWKVSDVKTGKPIQEFAGAPGKLLYLKIVSKDFSQFFHVHPKTKPNGVFVLDFALPRAGEYFVYADYITAKGGQEIGFNTLKIAGKNPLPSQPKFVPDHLKGAWIEKMFSAHDEGKTPRSDAPRYEVALMPMPGVLRAGEDAVLHFQVRDAKGKPLADLQPYLGEPGHAVVLAGDGKTYLHIHPMGAGDETGSGSDVMFHAVFGKAGIYKVWVQFGHKNKIITASYVLKVA